MPRYDYKCSVCDALFEVTRAAGDSAEQACPDCGSAAKRVFSPVGIVFKGSGFHNTDYRKSPAPDSGPSPEKARAEKRASAPCAGDAGTCASCPAADA